MQRLHQQPRKFAQFGNAGENVDQHHLEVPAFADPLQHFDQPRAFTPQAAGSHIEEVIGLQAHRAQLVDQHHRQTRAGGEQTNFAVGIDHHVVATVFQFKRGFGIGCRAVLQHGAGVVLAFECAVIADKLGVACDPGAVAFDEQRIDFDQHCFAGHEGVCEFGAGIG